MTNQSISVAITWLSDAQRQINVTIGSALPKQELLSPADAAARGNEESVGAPNAEILEAVPRLHMIRLAADPACRCQISQASSRTRPTNWPRIRFAMKWTSRLIAACDGYVVMRDSVIPIAATLAALFFIR
jgi:hypothetical protein